MRQQPRLNCTADDVMGRPFRKHKHEPISSPSLQGRAEISSPNGSPPDRNLGPRPRPALGVRRAAHHDEQRQRVSMMRFTRVVLRLVIIDAWPPSRRGSVVIVISRSGSCQPLPAGPRSPRRPQITSLKALDLLFVRSHPRICAARRCGVNAEIRLSSAQPAATPIGRPAPMTACMGSQSSHIRLRNEYPVTPSTTRAGTHPHTHCDKRAQKTQCLISPPSQGSLWSADQCGSGIEQGVISAMILAPRKKTHSSNSSCLTRSNNASAEAGTHQVESHVGP